jgi:hypothetical protein
MNKATDLRLQGDVQYQRIETLPDGLVPVKRDRQGRLVVAAGEATGHHHAIKERTAELFIDPETGLRFLIAPNGAVMDHEEHAPHVIEPGTYQFGHVAPEGPVENQRSYTPEEIIRAAD